MSTHEEQRARDTADLEKFLSIAPPDSPQAANAKELLSKFK